LSELLRRLQNQRVSKPIFLKVSPSLDDRGLDELLDAVDAFPNVRGFMLNLSPCFRSGLKTPPEQWKHLPGAISGAPIRDWMDDRVEWLYRRTDPQRHHIIAAGGVSSGKDAYRKIRRGASLVQLYTALIYHGPGVVRKIARGLSECLRRDGFERVADAVGVDAK
jgi:dihydroorotate dehydrogenase